MTVRSKNVLKSLNLPFHNIMPSKGFKSEQKILKGSYDAFLKIIILCIWCNIICWHALMFKKHIIFQILYIIVCPLCTASLKCFVFYKAPSFRQAQSALIGQLAQCIVIGRTPQAVSEM